LAATISSTTCELLETFSTTTTASRCLGYTFGASYKAASAEIGSSTCRTSTTSTENQENYASYTASKDITIEGGTFDSIVSILNREDWLSTTTANQANLQTWINSARTKPGIVDYSLLGIWELVSTMGQTKANVLDCQYCQGYPDINYASLSAALRLAFIDLAATTQKSNIANKPACKVTCGDCSEPSNSDCSCAVSTKDQCATKKNKIESVTITHMQASMNYDDGLFASPSILVEITAAGKTLSARNDGKQVTKSNMGTLSGSSPITRTSSVTFKIWDEDSGSSNDLVGSLATSWASVAAGSTFKYGEGVWEYTTGVSGGDGSGSITIKYTAKCQDGIYGAMCDSCSPASSIYALPPLAILLVLLVIALF